jgi:hypothetical protein
MSIKNPMGHMLSHTLNGLAGGAVGMPQHTPGMAGLHQMVGAAVMQHLAKHAMMGSVPHQRAVMGIMALHKLGQIGQQGNLYRATPGQPMGSSPPGQIQTGLAGTNVGSSIKV